MLRLGAGPSLDAAHRDFLLDRYLLPQPRQKLAPALTEFASGGMDVSDGFVGDLSKMLRVSGVSARGRTGENAAVRRRRRGHRA